MDPHTVADVLEIEALCSTYNRAFDERRAEDWAACFTEDGFFERSNAGRSYQGRTELAALAAGYPVTGRHITAEHLTDVHGDEATHSCYLVYFDAEKDFAVDLFGVYSDHLVRVDGKWLFKERRLVVDERGAGGANGQ